MKTLNFKAPSKVFGAISSESAVKILFVLSRNKEICVSEISDDIGLSMSATSHQLSKLEAAGLIYSKRTGRTICYLLKKDKFTASLVRCLEQLLSKEALKKSL